MTAITQAQAEQQSAERFAMLRVTPRRYISTGATVHSGTIYKYEFGFAIAHEKMEINGATMTRVFSLAAIVDGSANTYYFEDDESGIIYFHVSGGFVAANHHLVAFRYLFYTDRLGFYYFENPDDPSSIERLWDSRLVSVSPIRQSVKNALSGIFSIESSSFRLVNNDLDFQKQATADDSFRDCDVNIWFCIDSADSRQKVFAGKGKSVSLSDSSVTLSVYDSFSRMRQSAFFGDTAAEAVYQPRVGSYPGLDPKKNDQPCRLLLGKFSRWKTKPNSILAFGCEVLDPDFMNEAYCTDYTTVTGVTVNRQWTLCRTIDTVGTVTWGALFAITSSGNITFATFTAAVWATMDVVLGDNVKLLKGAFVAYGRVIRIVTLSGPDRREVTIATQRTSTPNFDLTTIITNYPAASLIIRSSDGNEYAPLYDIDYTIAETTTSGGNRLQKITFAANFEAKANFGNTPSVSGADVALGTLDPGKHLVFYRLRLNTPNATHGNVLKRICTDAGLTPNVASFAVADSAFAANCLMSVPEFDKSDYPSMIDVAQSIVDSTLGYVALNDGVEAQYKLLAAPGAGDVVDATWFIKGSLSSDVEYADIVTQIVASNPHDYSETAGAGSSAATSESERAKYLHKISSTLQMRHVLDTMAARLAAHLAVKSRPLVTYSWRTSARDLLLDIAEDVTLTDARVLGSTGTDNLKVIGTQKTPDGVAITAIPVDGL